jgi:hypothetical protein
LIWQRAEKAEKDAKKAAEKAAENPAEKAESKAQKEKENVRAALGPVVSACTRIPECAALRLIASVCRPPLGPIASSLQMFSEELCSRRRRQQSTPHRQAHRNRPHATRPVSLCVQAPKTAGSELAELNAVALCTELQHAYSNRTLISSIVKVRSAPPL